MREERALAFARQIGKLPVVVCDSPGFLVNRVLFPYLLEAAALFAQGVPAAEIDAALVSYLEGDGTSWKAVPGVARTPEEVLAGAGSRYTYSANTMAYADAVAGGAEKLALVGMSCQSSVPPVMRSCSWFSPALRKLYTVSSLLTASAASA